MLPLRQMNNSRVSYMPGQRWVSDTESDLGLGVITGVGPRTVTIRFAAAGEQRTYASGNAPLTRVRFRPGDQVRAYAGWSLTVLEVHERGGLLAYQGTRLDTQEPATIGEAELDSRLVFDDALSRLTHGQIDRNRWFDLRMQAYRNLDRMHGAETFGLAGARISLIPHQLFIAREVATRFAPRVLLADEVGLGKTIEACLIVHRQLITGRASRVLIVAPDTLVNQWLVELLRRFNLRFSLFDRERCTAGRLAGGASNPFLSEQLVLCGLDLFLGDPQDRHDALEAGWDILVVDEAHHLSWDETGPSEAYRFAEQMADHVPGVLLLTATPEQLGEAGHFARLRLLDPDRFSDFQSFVAEQQQYWRISRIAEDLLDRSRGISDTARRRIGSLLAEDVGELDDPRQRDWVLRKLIDRHGTSRVLFRNTRTGVGGFPQRAVEAYPLPCPTQYQRTGEGGIGLDPGLYPELTRPDSWTVFDPRVGFLRDLLDTLANKKLLVICAHAATAIALEQVLRTRYGIHAAMFHEHMRIVARDRAAAYFADPDGSRLLICSEIGSEGRNFQFAHHLVMFDLPLPPDLLEQRIGRLDRIGQSRTVHIHVPYLAGSAQELLYAWYHTGLDAFARSRPAGQSVYDDMRAHLADVLSRNAATEMEDVLDETRRRTAEKTLALQAGRDRLLELSSFDEPRARMLVSQIEDLERRQPVRPFLTDLMDAFGVEMEEKDPTSIVVRPSAHMRTSYFPLLKEDGLTATFDRATALAHEDREFLSWEHPMTQGALDLLLNGDHGKVAATSVESDLLPQGTLLVETLYHLNIIAPNKPELYRFLENAFCHLLVDEGLRDFTKLLDSQRLYRGMRDLDEALVAHLIEARKTAFAAAVRHSQDRADQTLRRRAQNARIRLTASLEEERARLLALKSVNASVNQKELDALVAYQSNAIDAFESAAPRLDAIRIIVVR